jgi:hypothetical protein
VSVDRRLVAAALAASALALALVPHRAEAQRTFTASRQLHGESRLRVRLDYAAGTLRVAPAEPAELYRFRAVYDDSRFAPVSDFSPADDALAVGLAPVEGAVRTASSAGGETPTQLATLGLPVGPELALDLRLGAVEGDVELGGLAVGELRLATQASRTVVHFSQPNAARCRDAVFSAGAAELAVVGLGNSRCDTIRFDGGLGSATLDFSGRWTTSTQVQVAMKVGELTLRLPRGVGVRLMMDRFLSSFRPTGLEARGGAFVSPGYDRATRHLDIDLTSTIGDIKVQWVD